MNAYLPYWLMAVHLPDVGPRTFSRWLQACDQSIQMLFESSDQTLKELNIPEKHIKQLRTPDNKLIEAELAWAKQDQHHLVTLGDEDYPPLLKEIADPPLVLYVKGNKTALIQPQIAIVGSRNATQSGINNAEQFAYHLATAGFAITSGLALGIDGASHKGALSAKGVTLGVAATGLNYIYPAAHKKLVTEIIENEGAIISEFPLQTKPKAWHFPRRNRIISGLSLGVLLVEAALKSGSLITARHALEQGREVFAIPGSIHQPLARGCHHLIRQGAKLVETAQDILEELGGLRAFHRQVKPSSTSTRFSALTAEQQHFLSQIDYELTPIDVILLRAGLTAGEVSSILLSLELDGLIQSVPGGYHRIQID